jgi:UDP-N-acetylglucosamine--N-acetylmuramyl-(pentapeptide) pyrophosphoryl-undecaprenol N-acetylglucosamine transferase
MGDCMPDALSTDRLHVVFAGGGSGGHLFPGLATAEALRRQAPHARITFAGGGSPFERRQVARAGFGYLSLSCRPLSRSPRLRDAFALRPWRTIPFVFAHLRGYRQANRFLRVHPASAVVGLGGYASAPMAWAAAGQHVPLVLLEQNAVAGLATRWLAPSATLVCAAMDCCRVEIERHLTSRLGKFRVTGTPIRSGFDQSPKPMRRRLLLVLGGSRGARSLNAHVPAALGRASPALSGWHVLHQAGDVDLDVIRRAYRGLGIRATVTRFIPDMPRAMAHAELAVCRAGGSTLAELAATGLPAVLVPYPHAAADHQTRNANAFVDAGGCELVESARRTGEDFEAALARAVSALVTDALRRAAMSSAMRGLARPDAARHVADFVLGLLEQRQRAA